MDYCPIRCDLPTSNSLQRLYCSTGYETTANEIALAVLLLLNHPEAMAKVEAELSALGLMGGGGGKQRSGGAKTGRCEGCGVPLMTC